MNFGDVFRASQPRGKLVLYLSSVSYCILHIILVITTSSLPFQNVNMCNVSPQGTLFYFYQLARE